jgi:precorrin-8X/cobalt-precorrin-8 methylmutase
MCDGDKPVLTDPLAIEAESFHIIDHELSPHFRFRPEEHAVVRRVIHATADFEYARTLRFSPDCFSAFEKAWSSGADLVCDVAMVQAGISKALWEKRGGKVLCPINDPSVAGAAKDAGHTRSIEAMRLAARTGKGQVLAIGNAPTALLEAQRLIIAGQWTPALIIGMPVGFVSAEESKHALEHGHAAAVPYITCLGRKGGTPAAVATVNALLRFFDK